MCDKKTSNDIPLYPGASASSTLKIFYPVISMHMHYSLIPCLSWIYYYLDFYYNYISTSYMYMYNEQIAFLLGIICVIPVSGLYEKIALNLTQSIIYYGATHRRQCNNIIFL